MIPHKDFVRYCVQAIDFYDTGFSLPGGELLLRDPDNELTTFKVVKRKNNAALPMPYSVTAYKRSCKLFFGYLCLPTRIPKTFEALMRADNWPVCKEPPTKFKRSTSEREEEQTTKRTKLEDEQKYRLHVDEDRVAMFLATEKRWIDKLIPNIQKYAVIAWGVIEQCLERTNNPFRLSPLMLYGCTVAEWLNNILADCADVALMASAISRYEDFIFHKILYKDKKFLIAKREGESPLLFLNESRPVRDCPDAFLAALFFYLYAGGNMEGLQMTEPDHLKFCLLDPVIQPLIHEEDQQRAASAYKHVLSEITGGRTQQKILSQFNTVQDLARYLIVDKAELKFDISTVYVQPESKRVIKLADRVCRWTNVTANPPTQDYATDPLVRKALTLSSEEIDMVAINALALEAGMSLHQVMILFTDCKCSLDEEKFANAFSAYREHLVQDDRLNLKILSEVTRQLELEERNADYVAMKDSRIVYAAGQFHAVHSADDKSDLLRSVNRKDHLELLKLTDAPPVSSLFTVDLDFAEYFSSASKGKLASAIQQAEVFQHKIDLVLKIILHDAFSTGPWKQTAVASSVTATLFTAFENADTYWIDFERFWENEEKKQKNKNIVPLYIVQNTDSRLLVHYSHATKFVVFEICDDVIERQQRLTALCNDYDGARLLETPLAKDNAFIVFMLHLTYMFRVEYVANYRDLLDRCKRETHLLSTAVYNIDVSGAENVIIFDDHDGDETMFTSFVQKTFLTLSKPYVSRRLISAADTMENIAAEQKLAVRKISVVGGSTLFIKNTTTPVLYLSNVVNFDEQLNSTLFDLWIASEKGTVGFLILPIKCTSSECPMDLDEPPIFPHYVTFAFTPDLYAVPLPQPTRSYGRINDTRKRMDCFSDKHQKLLRWASGQSLSAKDVADVVSWHTCILLRYTPKIVSSKQFSINYFDHMTLNNTLSTLTQDVVKNIALKEETSYATMQLSNEQFSLLFAMKVTK